MKFRVLCIFPMMNVAELRDLETGVIHYLKLPASKSVRGLEVGSIIEVPK